MERSNEARAADRVDTEWRSPVDGASEAGPSSVGVSRAVVERPPRRLALLREQRKGRHARVAPSPTVVYGARPTTLYARWFKRPIDVVVAGTLLVLVSPLLAVVALLVRVSVGRPVIFRQIRVGRDGKRIVIHKFRTMHPDRRSHRGVYGGVERRRCHKHPNDPRLTRVGRALRKWSLDELPQLYDVVRGTLSLVGPRPELPEIVERYEPWQHERHVVKPGLTGEWQVHARGEGEMHEHTEFDIAYVRRVTFRHDVSILVLTIPALLAGRGH